MVKVGNRGVPEKDFQKFNLKQFLNKTEKWIQIWRPPQVFINIKEGHLLGEIKGGWVYTRPLSGALDFFP